MGSNIDINIDVQIRRIVALAIKACGKPRIDICFEMEQLTGVQVPLSMLNIWSAESRCKSTYSIEQSNKRWGIPAEMVVAFCLVTNTYDLLHKQAECCGYTALKGAGVIEAKKVFIREEITKKNIEIEALKSALEGLD